GINGTDLERRGQLVLARLGQFANALRLLQHLLRLGDDAFAHWRQANCALGALENQYTQLILELLYADLQSRLADMAALGSAAKMLFLCKGHDIAQFGQCHSEYPSECPLA